jgi:hypothetical protein
MVKAYNPKTLSKAYKLAINFETCSKTYKKPFENMDRMLKAKTNTPNTNAHRGKMEKVTQGLGTLATGGSNIKDPT